MGQEPGPLLDTCSDQSVLLFETTTLPLLQPLLIFLAFHSAAEYEIVFEIWVCQTFSEIKQIETNSNPSKKSFLLVIIYYSDGSDISKDYVIECSWMV